MPDVGKLRNEVPTRGLAVKHNHIDAYNLPLWLPSELPGKTTCDNHLQLCEWELRKAQVDEALASMREALAAEYAVKEAKVAYGQGVRSGSKSMNKIHDSHALAEYHGRTYRRARKALTSLAEVLPSSITGDCLKNFPALNPWEVQLLPSAELELGDGKKQVKLSWIWKAYGSGADASDSTNDSKSIIIDFYPGLMKSSLALRLLWLRSRARAHRWKEEIELVAEEMARV
jgi:hypothetical protein